MLSLVTSLALLITPPAVYSPPAPAASDTTSTTWQIDVTHSELLFRVRHLVSRVTGTFTDWDGTITGDPADWSRGTVTVRIRTKSITTNHQRRDTHLRSNDFFATDSFPEMSFVSTGVAFNGDSVTLSGNLSIRGRTRPVVLTGSYLGMTPGREGRDRIGFEVGTKINRLDYGLTWNRAAEGGGVVLGDEVTISITVAAVKVVPGAPAPAVPPPPPPSN